MSVFEPGDPSSMGRGCPAPVACPSIVIEVVLSRGVAVTVTILLTAGTSGLDGCLRGESDTEYELAVWEYQHAESEGPLDIGKPRKTCIRSSPKLGPLSTDEIGVW